MAAGGQKFATRYTFSIFSWNPTFNIFFLYEGGKSLMDKFALKNAEFCLVSKTVKYVFVQIFYFELLITTQNVIFVALVNIT